MADCEYRYHMSCLYNCLAGPHGLALLDTVIDEIRVTYQAEPGQIEPEPAPGSAGGATAASGALRQTQRDALLQKLAPFAGCSSTGDVLEANIAFAAREFGLDTIEQSILGLIARSNRFIALENFGDRVLEKLNSASRATGAITGLLTRDIHQRIIPGSALLGSGLMTVEQQSEGLAGPTGFFQMSHAVRRVMLRPFDSSEAWIAALLGPTAPPTLLAEDFSHLGKSFTVLRDLLAATVRKSPKGLNILIYGPPGTGKTELAKTVAAEAGCQIWSAGEADVIGEEPTRQERIGSLRVLQNLLKARIGSVILFDEAEDAFCRSSDRRGTGSKIYANRVLENTPVPVIWVCNEISEFNPAIVRRMSLVIEVRVPGATVRERLWKKASKISGADLSADTVRQLAKGWATPPSMISATAQLARLVGGAEQGEVAVSTVTGIMRALGSSPVAGAMNARFNPALVACDLDVVNLADRLAAADAPRNWSICISGPSGTGKSEYARFLADRVGLPVIQKRGSDLMSKWIGETEQKIAAAFAEAQDEGALLIFDEADSLLAARDNAKHNWEVSQVNEMLTWMESHAQPFVCTTNSPSRLDQAALRRFSFRLAFQLLDQTRAVQVYQLYLGALPSRRLPDGLTPGDFKVISARIAILGTVSSTQIVHWLEEEAAARGQTRNLGFAMPASRVSPKPMPALAVPICE